MPSYENAITVIYFDCNMTKYEQKPKSYEYFYKVLIFTTSAMQISRLNFFLFFCKFSALAERCLRVDPLDLTNWFPLPKPYTLFVHIT